MKICLLHGNLGLPSDWDKLRELLASHYTAEGLSFLAPNLWQIFETVPSPRDALLKLANAIGDWAGDERCILTGYSLGGRLALQLLARAPSLFERAVIISAHPGLVDPHERAARRLADERWARRFESHEVPWNQLLEEWNAQSTLESSRPLIRAEGEISRGAIARGLREWSLGELPDSWRVLRSIEIPLLWLSGSEDRKFMAFSHDVAALGNRQIECVGVAGAGHRVIFDRPAETVEVMKHFLSANIANNIKKIASPGALK